VKELRSGNVRRNYRRAAIQEAKRCPLVVSTAIPSKIANPLFSTLTDAIFVTSHGSSAAFKLADESKESYQQISIQTATAIETTLLRLMKS
jgi:predicted 2-oxoglutarate/Fe(II)-dependent dioxygenase YbiX